MTGLRDKKIAIVHDAIVAYGGGENVLETMYEIFPNADFYTSYVSGLATKGTKIPKNIKTTWLQKFSLFEKYPRLIQLLAPFVWRNIVLDKYDVVITHSGFYMSNLVNRKKIPGQFTFCYMITPPKNVYKKDHQDGVDKILNKYYYGHLKSLDKKAVRNISSMAVVSKEVKKRISGIYKKDPVVIYPPVNLPKNIRNLKNNANYFCYAGRYHSSISSVNFPKDIFVFKKIR